MIKGISKVALIKGGGVAWTQTEEDASPGQVNQREISTKDTGVPHPDLSEKFEDLKRFFLRSMNLDPFAALFALEKADIGGATAKEKGAVKDLSKTLVKLQSEILEKIEIRSVAISGTEEKPKVVISGVIESPLGGKLTLNTPLIPLANSKLGYEAEILDNVEELIQELEEYRMGKRQQLTMDFGESSEEPKEEEPKKRGPGRPHKKQAEKVEAEEAA